MARYTAIAGVKKTNIRTPQTKPIPGREAEMSQNAAGGYGFTLDNFTRLNRFLILGVEGNTYYQSQGSLVKSNAKAVREAIKEDPRRVVDAAVDVLVNRRSLKTDAALFVLALVGTYKNDLKVPVKTDKNFARLNEEYLAAAEIRTYANRQAVDSITTPTDLFKYLEMARDLGSKGHSIRKAVARYYENTPVKKLAMHAWKYKSRDGWSHQDAIRLSHPQDQGDAVRSEILTYMSRPERSVLTHKGEPILIDESFQNDPLMQIRAAEELVHLTGDGKKEVARAVELITKFRLTHEVVPNHLKDKPAIWEALARDMPMWALVRNLNKMTAVGYISRLSDGEKYVASVLSNAGAVQKSGIHPFRILLGMKQYAQGRGDKGSMTWTPSAKITDALDDGFELAFGNVEPTGKRMLIAVDESGSMTGAKIGGTNMTVSEAAAAMALIQFKVEDSVALLAYSDRYVEVEASKKSSMRDLMRLFGRGAGTNTALPFQYLLDKKLNVDAVVSYTDNNSWGAGYGYGRTGHVSQLAKECEKKFGHPIRFINVAMESNATTDADPTNPNMFEVTGLDASTPELISNFVAGRF